MPTNYNRNQSMARKWDDFAADFFKHENSTRINGTANARQIREYRDI